MAIVAAAVILWLPVLLCGCKSEQTPTIQTATSSPADLPVIIVFDSIRGQKNGNNEILLQWDVAGAENVSIDQGIGNVGSRGDVAVSPLTTTTYTIKAVNALGTISRSVIVTIDPPPSSTTPAPPKYATYTDASNDFSIDYPAGWSSTGNAAGATMPGSSGMQYIIAVFKAPQNINGNEPQFIIEKRKGIMNPYDYFQRSAQSFSTNGYTIVATNSSKVLSNEPPVVIIADNNALDFSMASISPNGIPVNSHHLLLFAGGDTWFFVWHCNASYPRQYELYDMLNSFRFID